jgi:hypothetical protein
VFQKQEHRKLSSMKKIFGDALLSYMAAKVRLQLMRNGLLAFVIAPVHTSSKSFVAAEGSISSIPSQLRSHRLLLNSMKLSLMKKL